MLDVLPPGVPLVLSSVAVTVKVCGPRLDVSMVAPLATVPTHDATRDGMSVHVNDATTAWPRVYVTLVGDAIAIEGATVSRTVTSTVSLETPPWPSSTVSV